MLRPGSAYAASNEVSIREEGGFRVIRSNAIPAHPTGAFPNRGNPHAIEPQRIERRVTLSPSLTGRSQFSNRYGFGIAVNGVPFEPLTGEFWNRDPRLDRAERRWLDHLSPAERAAGADRRGLAQLAGGGVRTRQARHAIALHRSGG